MTKLDQLTSTRFIAAFMVLLFHGGRRLFPFSLFPINPLLTSGQTAVSYFFVLSGFVMTLVYYRPGKSFDFRAYWTARFSRIYPVYILAFAITCFYYLDLMAKMKYPKIWANIFLYQSWIPKYSQSFNMAAWSLSVEAFFYILVPLLVIWLARVSPRRMMWLSIGFWVVSQIIHSTMYITMMPDASLLLGYFPAFHLSVFLLGFGGGIWFVARSSDIAVDQKTNRLLLFAALALVSAALIGRQLAPRSFRSLSLDIGSGTVLLDHNLNPCAGSRQALSMVEPPRACAVGRCELCLVYPAWCPFGGGLNVPWLPAGLP